MAFQNAIDQVQLQLVGLDEWSFNVHSGPGRTYCSQPGNDGSKYINIGVIKLENYANFLETAQKLLKGAENRNGEERSANSNKQAHFIESSSFYKLVNKTSTSVNNSGTSKDTRYDKSNSGR